MLIVAGVVGARLSLSLPLPCSCCRVPRGVLITLCAVLLLRSSQGKPERTISVDEEAMTATVAAGVTQRTLLRFLDNYRCGAA